MRKSLGGLGALLVMGIGFGLLRGNPAPAPTNPSHKEAAKERPTEELSNAVAPAPMCAKPCVAEDMLNAVDTFFAHKVKAKDITDEKTKPLVEEFAQLAKSANDVKFAIAIVPDPIHTHLSLFFDRAVDAIEQGAQEAGWIFDRATMPWDSQQHPESTDMRIRLWQKQFVDDKEGLPGLMIFRRPNQAFGDPNSSLFVFVVGETPTGGVNKEQFITAVKLMASATKGEYPLRIIGPDFSGSLYSLAQLLNQESSTGRFSDVVIRSGTISSWFTTHWFETWIEGEKAKPKNALNVDFATFLQNDRYKLRKFIRYERIKGYAPAQIAVLAEDETAYGTQSSSRLSATPAPNCPEGDGIDAQDEETLEKEEGCVVRLYFPRDISQLRSAYQQGLDKQGAASSDPYEIHSVLPLNLEDTGSDDDSVSQYAHTETPLSQESILLGIVTALRKHKIESIVVQATNPMDSLFLSRILRKGYPEGRVVTAGADLLLRRDVEDDSLLHGVMSLSTYSLLPGSDDDAASPVRLERTQHADHTFPGEISTAIFNATLAQLTAMASGGAGAQEATLPVARYSEYGWPVLGSVRCDLAQPLSPVVWLTVLGRDGYWPLAILDDGASTQAGDILSSLRPVQAENPPSGSTAKPCGVGKFHKGACIPPFHRHSPLVWKLFYGLILALVGIYLQILWKSSIAASSALMTQLAPVKDRRRAFLIAIVGWMLLAALLLLLWPWRHWPAMSYWWVAWVIGIFALSLFCGCFVALHRRGDNLVAGIFAGGAIAIAIAFFVTYGGAADYAEDTFLYRYIHLSSGVSPLLPFLCLLAAGLWWAWFAIVGLTLVDKRHPKLPKAKDFPPIVDGHVMEAVSPRLSASATRNLMHVMQPAGWDLRVYLPALFCSAVTLFALDYRHPLLSLETREFEYAYVIALGFAALALFCALFRLLVTWIECRKLLSALDRLPVRRAFAELDLGWGPIWRLGGGRWQEFLRLLSRQVEILEHLNREIEQEEGEEVTALRDSIAEIGAQSTARQRSSGRRFGEPEPELSDGLVTDFGCLQNEIACTCAKALAYLQTKWWESDGLILREAGLGDDKVKVEVVCESGKQDPELSLSVRLAERFVALVYLNFILNVLLRMRTLWMAGGGLYIFLLLSVNSYPFEPKVALRSMAILLLILLIGTVGYTFAQISRNSILSLVTQTTPGELGMEFWVRMSVFVALPVLSLLVSQFPALNNALFSWLEPALSALK